MSIILLGSTGSIGTQTIDVALKNNVKIEAIAANKNAVEIEAQARKLKVKACALFDLNAAKLLKIKLSDTDIKVYSGIEGICEMISDSEADTVLNAIIGGAGLKPTLTTIEVGKKLALANKESLVVAGEVVMAMARDRKVPIIPVDSEHCAIHQCLRCGDKKEVQKLILTASGGPFFGKKKEEILNVTVKDVLAHPTWNMGAKITVDSATLMNKGFEVIEAMHLFNVPTSKIDVLVHRESIIHSMVEYIDNSVVAQLSVPDMRSCIQYALEYPRRAEAVIKPLDLSLMGSLSFFKPDRETFTLLDSAYYAAEKGGALPAVLNAANEVAVEAFLQERISFNTITCAVRYMLETMACTANLSSLDDIISIDNETRIKTEEWLKNKL